MAPSVRRQGLLALITVVLTWGLTWPVNKVVLASLPPIWAVSFRAAIATVALFALQAAGGNVTDESSAMEASGLKPKLVPGSAQNFKVTWPEDFALAEAVLGARARAHAMDRATPDGRQAPASYDYP